MTAHVRISQAAPDKQHPPAGRSPDRLLRLSQVIELTGIGKTMIYRLISKGSFPQQFKPGGFASRWSESEVMDWIRSSRS